MYMLAFQNARERTADDWKALFVDVDPRFRLTKIHQPLKSSLAIVEVTWEDLGQAAVAESVTVSPGSMEI